VERQAGEKMVGRMETDYSLIQLYNASEQESTQNVNNS